MALNRKCIHCRISLSLYVLLGKIALKTRSFAKNLSTFKCCPDIRYSYKSITSCRWLWAGEWSHLRNSRTSFLSNVLKNYHKKNLLIRTEDSYQLLHLGDRRNPYRTRTSGYVAPRCTNLLFPPGRKDIPSTSQGEIKYRKPILVS